jgi:transposase
LWVVLGPDTVIYRLESTRSHTVPEDRSRAESRGVLVVDRYSAYKAMIWVKDGVSVLAFCWAHVRRDFVRVGEGWPELKPWASQWLRRIRVLDRLNDRRLAIPKDAAAFGEADGRLRQAVAEMKTEMETELGRGDLATPCRKALESLQEHWEGLTRLVDDPRTRWTITPRDDAHAVQRWRGRTSTARVRSGAASRRRRCSRSRPRCRPGSSMLGNG